MRDPVRGERLLESPAGGPARADDQRRPRAPRSPRGWVGEAADDGQPRDLGRVIAVLASDRPPAPRRRWRRPPRWCWARSRPRARRPERPDAEQRAERERTTATRAIAGRPRCAAAVTERSRSRRAAAAPHRQRGDEPRRRASQGTGLWSRSPLSRCESRPPAAARRPSTWLGGRRWQILEADLLASSQV